MQLTRIERHGHYVNLRNEIYKCEPCGETRIIAVRIG
jgi:hypothetical protein